MSAFTFLACSPSTANNAGPGALPDVIVLRVDGVQVSAVRPGTQES